MSVISSFIKNELIRNMNMITEYKKKLESLPRGTIVKKVINGKEYCYLAYREKKKVVTKYIGNNEEKVKYYKELLVRRMQIEAFIKSLKEERSKLLKMEALIWSYITVVM